MRLLFTVAIASFLAAGCVAGPEEIAENKKRKDDAMSSRAAANSEHENEDESSMKQASASEPSAASVPSEGFKSTDSGLEYKIIKEGKGKRPTASSTVKCHYRGWLDNGKEFDSSYKGGEPISFPLNGVIAGWTEGLQLIKEGGEIELRIPSRLGYGERGAPGSIPPNARLHFKIELLQVR